MKSIKPFFAIVFLMANVKASDPCADFIPIDDWKRSVANSDMTNLLCDAFLEDGWYKGVSHAGNEIPTSCPVGGFRCGTAKPIWINGSNPSIGETANVTACVSDYNSCCSKSYNIQVKNCNGYFVYNLRKTNGCAQAYCFGTEEPCPPGETSENGFTPGCKYEPCLPVNHQPIDEWERSIKNNFSDKLICDAFLKEGWYRPTSKAGMLMPAHCPIGGFTCSTVKPIWMNGAFPNNGETSNVTACAASYQSCCEYSYNIHVRNCSSFLIYKLIPTTGCAQAYCFGSEIPCPAGYSSDNGFTPGCTVDPCNELNYKLLVNQVRRSSNYTLKASDEAYDDSTLTDDWYRILSYTGNDIVNTPQPVNQCGTLYPIWMQGNLPQVNDKTVNRSMCITTAAGVCTRVEISVRNCGAFRTYYLPRVNIPYAGYCFDKTDLIWKISLGCVGMTTLSLVIFLMAKYIINRISSPPPYSQSQRVFSHKQMNKVGDVENRAVANKNNNDLLTAVK